MATNLSPTSSFDINGLVSDKLKVRPLEEGQFAMYKLVDSDKKDFSRVEESTGKFKECKPRRSMKTRATITDPYNGFKRILIENIVGLEPIELPGGQQSMKKIVKRVNFPSTSTLTLNSDHAGTYAFLERHPCNRDNPFRDKTQTPIFYRVNAKKKAIVEMENEYVLLDALNHIKGADETELKSIYSKLDPTSKKNINAENGFETLKRDIFQLAKNFPVLVMKASSNKEARMKIQIMDAEYFNIITFVEDAETNVGDRRWETVENNSVILCKVEITENKFDGLLKYFFSGKEGNDAYLKVVNMLKKVTSPALKKQLV